MDACRGAGRGDFNADNNSVASGMGENSGEGYSASASARRGGSSGEGMSSTSGRRESTLVQRSSPMLGREAKSDGKSGVGRSMGIFGGVAAGGKK